MQGRGALEALVLQTEPRAAAAGSTQSRLDLTAAASSARNLGVGAGLQTVVGVGARCRGLASSPLPLGSSRPSLCQDAREVGVCAGFSELASGSCVK